MSGVLIVAERAEPQAGGLAVATSRIAGHAAAGGDPVHLVVLSRDVAPGARGHRVRDGIEHHLVGAFVRPEESLRALVAHATELTGRHDLDLVHGIYATRPGYAATLVADQVGAASVVSIRGNDFDLGIFKPAEIPLVERALARADLVTAVSTDLAGRAARFSGRPVRHITNAVDADRFLPEAPDNSLRAALGLQDGAVIGFLGELREKKGMRFLLPAFDRVLADRPAHLLLLGGVRADSEARYAAFLQMAPKAAERIHVVPYKRSPQRLSKLMALCDLMVFPSLYDGTPNAVLEAMAAARPILATAAGGQRDLIEHGRTGALLPLEDLDVLPEAIEELLALPKADREALGKAAREHVLTAHHPSGERAAYRAAYADARAARAKKGLIRPPAGVVPETP